MRTEQNQQKAAGERPLAVSPGQASKLVGVGRTKLYEAINRGELRSSKIGARRLITMAALEDWLAAQEVSIGGRSDHAR